MEFLVRLLFAVFVGAFFLIVYGRNWSLRRWRIKRYFKGRRLETKSAKRLSQKCAEDHGLRFGNDYLPTSALTGHCVLSGTSGSGKTLAQRLFIEKFLKSIVPGSDSRVFIYDAKGEVTAFLNKIGVTAPIYSLYPFESRETNPMAVSWDIGKDITCPTRADNLAQSMVKGEAKGPNGYFTLAARIVQSAIVKSFMRHSGTDWRFSDLVNATTNASRIKEVLRRDAEGQSIIEDYLGDNNTGYGVATTLAASMELYAPIAALWQRAEQSLSIRDFLEQDAILLIGNNETASAVLDVINDQLLTFYVEEVMAKENTSRPKYGLWIDETQEAEAILQSGKVKSFAAFARSRGGWLLIAFQDIEGFRLAAGDPKAADSIIAQCNNKALLRQESFESAEWASKLVGQHETIEVFHSESHGWNQSDRGSEQRVVKDTLLPSEFYSIPETHPDHGLTGVLISTRYGARYMTIPPDEVQPIVVSDSEEKVYAIVTRPESDQWIRRWTLGDKQRLGLTYHKEPNVEVDEGLEEVKKKKLQLRTKKVLEQLSTPTVS